MRPGDPRAGLSHARPGPTDPQPCGAEIRSGKHMVGGRKGRAGGSKRRADPGSCFHGNGGSQFSEGRSSQQGLPRPTRWGSPRLCGSGARSFRSGRKGLTAVPLGVSPAPKSLVSQYWAPLAHAAAPARSRTRTATPPPAYTRTHARPRRAPRTQRTPSCLTSRKTHAPPQCGVESSQRESCG